MAILHAATITPTKGEMISAWLPTQSWAPPGDAALVDAYRFDDPEGAVGMEVHLVRCGGELLQVPLTYRDAALDGADDHLLGTMEHSVLGRRWIYDGLGDPVFVRMLAAVTMTGCGQAVGMVEYRGRWVVAPPTVRLAGGGWSGERVPVDEFVRLDDDGHWAVLRNDRIELRAARRPAPGATAAMALTATWPDQDEPLVLATVRDLSSH